MPTKSKWFRVALEGATRDGRELTRAEIVDMASTYNRETYGARVNMEHFRGLTAGSPFDMLGDVIAAKSQEDEVEIGGKKQKRMALYAQIEPLPNLIALNKSGQKIYTSIEMQPDFAKTGKAGLVGLAITDSPASLGTEVLQFAAKHPAASPFTARKQSADNLFTEALETKIDLVDEAETPTAEAGAFAALSKLFTALIPGKPEPKADPVITPSPQTETSGEGNVALSALAAGMTQFTTTIGETLTALTAAQKATDEKLSTLTEKLESTPAQKHLSKREPATGGDGRVRADC